MEGDILKGDFFIVCNQGEYNLSFVVSVSRLYADTSAGRIKNLNDFTGLAKSSAQEAYHLFYSGHFKNILKPSEVRERLLARPAEPEPSEAAPPVRQHSAPPQRGERRQPQPPSYTPPPQPQPVSSAPQKPVRIADTDTLAPDAWPAYWQTLLKKTPPRPSLVWSYPSLSRDLGGDADAAHRDFLRRLLGDMALPKGSHAFWPLNRYPYGDGESEQTVDARMFLSGIAALKPESVILMCGQVPPELGLAELRPLSPSIVHGHRYVVTPHVDDLIGEPQRYAQLITFLKSIIAGR